MDPLSAIGLASAIVQFVQFGFQIADRLQDLTSKHPGQIPKALQGISMHLPLLANSLSKIKSDARISAFDFDTKCILKGIVSGCLTQVQEVEAMLEEIACTPGDSLKTKLKKVMTSMKYEERLSRIERNLNTYISVLILHHVVDAADAPKDLLDETYFDVREKLADAYIERKVLIEQLDTHFYDASRSQVTSPTVLLLSGKKGAGKTQLALGYCHNAHKLQQFRTVFWLDASTLENLNLGFERMYATVNQSVQGTRADKIRFMRNFLEELWHPWLLILDNYDSALLYNNIMDFLPSRGSGGVLLLSEETENGLGKVIRVPNYLRPHEQERVDSLLQSAVQNKDFAAIKEAVEQGADVNTKLWEQWPCIHRLALFGMHEALQYLVNHGADLQVDAQIAPTLHWAAVDGSEGVTRLLLDYEDKQLVFYSQATHQAAFSAAVENGHMSVARMLLQRRNVSIHATDRYNQTALESAADKGKVDLVRLFISQGALRDEKTPGEKALIKAAAHGHLETVKMLCLEGGVNANARRDSGDSALMLAADSDYNTTTFDLATFLLEQGASPDPIGHQDGLLHRACIRGKLEFVQLLLKYKADPTVDGAGYNPLQYALKYDNPEIVDVLLKTDIADAEKRAAWLESALLFAARTGKRGAVLQLLEQGANIDAQLKEGSPIGATSLLLATLAGHVQTAQFLVRRKARQDIADVSGRLPLPSAVAGGHHLLVRDLIRAGGDSNMKSGADDNTALMIAVAAKHEKVVEVLLKNGADAELTNKFGEIALDIAEEKDHKDIIKLLDQ
ncbi:ankyrin 2,3/unc44 [Cordyceps javanica]|uniref:Ankyrin 2,3/unc44 n=1 Tax=Cordyceps javanica TaxID=43265 RepID=A0A545VY05_9HYPO|nr:ankyrin 2,3/unc44 [Cordyceps javanica]TQW06576.1 ankyrin 2,3/unc44 [Cordyceps javanica]